MITKELFIESMAVLKKQHDYDKECAKAFATILKDNFTTGYDNDMLYTQMIRLMGCGHPYGVVNIEYFIDEIEFGSKYYEGCFTETDGTPIDISDAEKLYGYLEMTLNK